MSIQWLIIAESKKKKALYFTISDNSRSLAETAAAFLIILFLSLFFFFLFHFPPPPPSFFSILILLTFLAFVSLCFLYGITNVKGILFLCCAPPLLSRFSCCPPDCDELFGRHMSANSPSQIPLDFLKEHIALS